MECNKYFDLSQISNDPKGAIKYLVETLFTSIYPLMIKIRSNLQQYVGVLSEEEVSKIQDVYVLCTNQIKKCLQTLLDIFKMEYHQGILMQETRQCVFERLEWCMNRLCHIEEKLNQPGTENQDKSLNDSMLVTPMYFVNWIDHTFEILSKLSDVIYRTDYKESKALREQWKNDVCESVSMLHVSMDELLLSAMTLCKHCLPADQHIVKARCQVVLRETKALLSELVEGNIDGAFKVTVESLKLPIMPSNVNVLIDVLRDVLYVLETNTNTALLALVVHCFSYSVSPANVLKHHFLNCKGTCSCHVKSEDEVTEDCSFVKDFDLYNERLLQIGSFAVSCSSDQGRILFLRSGLASLEALDPHLVPALMLSPSSHHAQILTDTWHQEVQEIRDNIFLIVDPAAFTEKSKQLMHYILLDVTKESQYDNERVCSVINMACVLKDFFLVYNKLEPDALTGLEQLVSLLADLDKVQVECKIVNNLLCLEDDYKYEVKKSKNTNKVTVEQLFKRLKLLYTLVCRINSLFHPKENEELFDCDIEDEAAIKNTTHTVGRKNLNTYYVQSPKKPTNFSRSIFARTNIRSSTNKYPLQKLTRYLKVKQLDEVSFSVKLDEMFNLSEVKGNLTEDGLANKQLNSVREASILYNYSPKKRASLRKAVLNRHCVLPFDTRMGNKSVEALDNSEGSMKGSLMDEVTSLQITDILNQMSNISNAFCRKPSANTTYSHADVKGAKHSGVTKPNVLRININTNNKIEKHVWNIPVNASALEFPLDDSVETMASNITLPSNVTTLERINDIDLVESRLNSLKSLEETSL